MKASVRRMFLVVISFAAILNPRSAFADCATATVDLNQLMEFAMDYDGTPDIWPSGRAVISPRHEHKSSPSVVLEIQGADPHPGGFVTARLRVLRGNALQGIHARVSWDRNSLLLEGSQPGGVLRSAGGAFAFGVTEGKDFVEIDAAVLGAGRSLEGSGELAVLSFRARSFVARPRLVEVDLRDSANRSVASDGGPTTAQGAAASIHTRGSMIESQRVEFYPNGEAGAPSLVLPIDRPGPLTVQLWDRECRVLHTLCQLPVSPTESTLPPQPAPGTKVE